MSSATGNWSESLEHAVLSDIGMRRSNNQDSYAVALAADENNWQQRGHVFVVADGMGAHAAGELASKIAADGIPHSYHKLAALSPPDALRKSIETANRQIHERGQSSPDFHGMGTTCSVLVLLPHGAVVGHVGDSRVYRLRDQHLEQLTFDHSLVWEMTASGQLTEDAIQGFVRKNIITRSLGPHGKVQVDLEGPFALEQGDTFLLCSDGLSGQVTDEEMGVLMGCLPPGDAVRVLIDIANLRGGPDNITVIIARVKGQEITTAAANPAEPLRVSAESPADVQPKSGAHPAFWILAGVLLVIAVVLAALGMLIPAAGTLVGALLIGGIGAMQQFGNGGQVGAAMHPGAMLGAGPHTNTPSVANEKMVKVLADLVDQLRDAATSGKFNLDWTRFDTYRKRSAAAAAKRDYPLAVVEYSRALRFMMSELRNQAVKRPKPSDSDVL